MNWRSQSDSLSIHPIEFQLNYETDVTKSYLNKYLHPTELSPIRRSTDDSLFSYYSFPEKEEKVTDRLGLFNQTSSSLFFGSPGGRNVEMKGASPFADSLVIEAHKLVGTDVVMQGGRRKKTCADLLCNIYSNTGLDQFLAKGKDGVVSSSNDFIIDNLSSSQGVGVDWIDVKNTANIAKGDWIILNVAKDDEGNPIDNPSGNFKKHSFFISAVKKYHYEVIDEPGKIGVVRKRIIPKQKIWRSAVKILRLYPSEDKMYKDIFDDKRNF